MVEVNNVAGLAEAWNKMNYNNFPTDRDSEVLGLVVCSVLAVVSGLAALYCFLADVPNHDLGFICAGVFVVCIAAALIYPEAPFDLLRLLLWR